MPHSEFLCKVDVHAVNKWLKRWALGPRGVNESWLGAEGKVGRDGEDRRVEVERNSVYGG